MSDYMISASYEGSLVYWFYRTEDDTIVKRSQMTIESELRLPHHFPYLLTFDGFNVDGHDILAFDQVQRYYALKEQWVTLNRPLCVSPTVIYNQKTDTGLRKTLKTSYEDDYTYINRAATDYHLLFGYPYGVLEYPKFELPFALNDQEKFLRFVDFYKKLLETPAPKMKRCGFDIEVAGVDVEDEEEIEPKTADVPVVAASIVGSDGTRISLILKRDGTDWSSYIGENGVIVQVYNTEVELHRAIYGFLKQYPVVLTFFGDGFDLYYMYQRSKKIGIKYEEIPIRLNFSKIHRNQECYFTHALHIDMFKLLGTRFLQQALKSDKLARRGLNEYSKLLLGKEKKKMPDLNKCSLQEMVDYNLWDSVLTLELSQFDGDKALNLAIVISRLTNCPLDMSTRKSASALLKHHLKWIHLVLGYLFPNQSDLDYKRQFPVKKSEFSDDKYMGAIILAPKPGIHFNVQVLDYASLYASVTDIHNVSYETIACGHEECRENIVPYQTFYVCKRNRGILSLTIGAIRYLRVNYFKKGKSPWEQAVTAVLKLFGNATYGIFGSEKFVPDLYLPPVSASIAAYGRSHLQYALKSFENEGYPALYSDTDSLFIQADNKEPLVKIADAVKKSQGVDLDFDKDFRVAILWKKKHYIGVGQDGKVTVKGMTGEKYHVCIFIKRVFDKVKHAISEIKTPEDFQEVRKSIAVIVKSGYSELKLGKWELKELVFMVKLDKAASEKKTQDYVVAQQYNEQGLRKTAGDWIYKIFTKGEHSAKPFEFTKREEVDINKYCEHLQGALEQVLEPMGIGLQGILSDYAPLINFAPLEIRFEGDTEEPEPAKEEVIDWWQPAANDLNTGPDHMFSDEQ